MVIYHSENSSFLNRFKVTLLCIAFCHAVHLLIKAKLRIAAWLSLFSDTFPTGGCLRIYFPSKASAFWVLYRLA